MRPEKDRTSMGWILCFALISLVYFMVDGMKDMRTITERRAGGYRGGAPILSKDFPDAGRRRGGAIFLSVNLAGSN